MESISKTKRFLKVLYFFLFASVGLYWLSMESMAANIKPAEVGALKTGLILLATTTATGVLYVRFSRMPTLLSSPTGVTRESVRRVQFYYILCYVLSESVALYGFVLFVLGGTRGHAAFFFVGAAFLFLICYPRVPETVGQSYNRTSDQKQVTQSPSTSVFHSSPRLPILRAAALAAATGLGLLISIVKVASMFEGITVAPWGYFAFLPILGAFYLLGMALRSRKTVIVNEGGLTIQQGKREKTFPWNALIDEGALKPESMLGWKQLILKTTIAGQKTTLTMAQVFGAGLPVNEIEAAMEPWINSAKRDL